MKKKLVITIVVLGLLLMTFEVILVFKKTETILSFSNCLLPCWNNIIPGKTTIFEAKQIMTSSRSKFKVKYFDYLQEIDFIISLDPLGAQEVHGVIATDGGKVSTVWIGGKTGNTMKEVITEIDTPVFVISTRFGGGGITLAVLYPQKGVAVLLPKQSKGIFERTEISALLLFDSKKFSLDNNNLPIGELKGKNVQEIIYPWKGYGQINDLYPPK